MNTLMIDWKKASTVRLTIRQRREGIQTDQLVKLWWTLSTKPSSRQVSLNERPTKTKSANSNRELIRARASWVQLLKTWLWTKILEERWWCLILNKMTWSLNSCRDQHLKKCCRMAVKQAQWESVLWTKKKNLTMQQPKMWLSRRNTWWRHPWIGLTSRKAPPMSPSRTMSLGRLEIKKALLLKLTVMTSSKLLLWLIALINWGLSTTLLILSTTPTKMVAP